ncbi:MAG TPA: hypothetical protein VIK09_05005 [Candidatus Humimicrobiaceae bacterium]
MFDKFTAKAEKNRDEISELITSNKCLKFEYLNRFSKAFYLYWLNDNKASRAMYSKTDKPFNMYCNIVYIEMFKRNINLIYKPLKPIIEKLENF